MYYDFILKTFGFVVFTVGGVVCTGNGKGYCLGGDALHCGVGGLCCAFVVKSAEK